MKKIILLTLFRFLSSIDIVIQFFIKKNIMSKKKIQINIPEPCHKKFKEMITARGGNFCDSCEKVVVDFTNMTDDEIAKSFIKNKSRICGQFRNDQLDRKINLTPPPVNSYRGKAASILLSGAVSYTHLTLPTNREV